MRNKEENYLDKIPMKSPNIQYHVNEEKHIIIMEKHENIYDRLCQHLLKKPKETKIELDVYGSYVWERINGQKNIYEIGKEVSQNFGTEIEPLYERMALFIRNLEIHGLVFLKKIKNVKK